VFAIATRSSHMATLTLSLALLLPLLALPLLASEPKLIDVCKFASFDLLLLGLRLGADDCPDLLGVGDAICSVTLVDLYNAAANNASQSTDVTSSPS